MTAGDQPLFAAFNKVTQLYDSFCMEETPGFAEWVKGNIAGGLEIHDMTVAEAVQWLDDARQAA